MSDLASTAYGWRSVNVRGAMSAVLACVLVLSACSDGGDPEQVVLPSPSVSASAEAPGETPAASPSASAEAPDDAPDEIDVTTIPDEITPEYIEAVYQTISRGRLPYTAAVLEAPPNELAAVPTGTRQGLATWLAGTQLRVAMASLEDLASNDARRSEFRPVAELGATTADVLRVVASSRSCLVAVARLDDTGLSPSGGPSDVLTILSFSPNETPGENPTAWLIRDQLRNTDSEGEPNPDSFALEAGLDTIAEAADITCEGSG